MATNSDVGSMVSGDRPDITYIIQDLYVQNVVNYIRSKMGYSLEMIRPWLNYLEKKMDDAPVMAAPTGLVQETPVTVSPSPSHEINTNLCSSTEQGRVKKGRSKKNKDSAKFLAAYAKTISKRGTEEGTRE